MEYDNENIFRFTSEKSGYCPCNEGMLNTLYCASKERCDGIYSSSLIDKLPVLKIDDSKSLDNLLK